MQPYKLFLYFATVGILGFRRGIQNYTYEIDKNNMKYDRKRQFFYSECFMEGLCGSVIYAFPPTFLFSLPKEVYRLEVNLRNLEEEKKTDYYNSLV